MKKGRRFGEFPMMTVSLSGQRVRVIIRTVRYLCVAFAVSSYVGLHRVHIGFYGHTYNVRYSASATNSINVLLL